MFFTHSPDINGSFSHFFLEFFSDLGLTPVEVGIILYLFEITYGNSSRISKDIRDHGDVSCEEYLIGFQSRRSVGELEDQARLDLWGIVFRETILESCGDQDISLSEEELVCGEFFSPLIGYDGFFFGFDTDDLSNIYPYSIIDRSLRIRYPDKNASCFLEKSCHRESCISSSLENKPLPYDGIILEIEIGSEDEYSALRSRFASSARSSYFERLSSE